MLFFPLWAKEDTHVEFIGACVVVEGIFVHRPAHAMILGYWYETNPFRRGGMLNRTRNVDSSGKASE